MIIHRLLIVDDDEGTRLTAQAGLSIAGFAVSSTSNGAEAVKLARSFCPHFAIIDQRLPDMMGTDLMAIMREEHPCPDMLLLSGFLTVTVTVDAMRLVGVSYFRNGEESNTATAHRVACCGGDGMVVLSQGRNHIARVDWNRRRLAKGSIDLSCPQFK